MKKNEWSYDLNRIARLSKNSSDGKENLSPELLEQEQALMGVIKEGIEQMTEESNYFED